MITVRDLFFYFFGGTFGDYGEIFDETVGVFVLNMKIQGKHYGHFGGNFFGGTLGYFLGKL